MSNLQVQEYLTQGAMLETQEKYEEALEYYNKALELDVMNHDAYISKGVALANLENFEEAQKQFENALKINRTSGLAYFHLGNIALLKEEMALGFENYNKAISNGFDDAQIYYNIGLLHEENGEADLALRNYSKAISKNALRPEIRLRKVQLQIFLEQYNEALQSLDEMILTNPDVFEGYHTKFIVYMQLGQHDKAEEILEKAMELFPDDIDFVIDKTTLLIAQGNTEEAFVLLKELEENAEGDPEILYKVYMERAQIHASKQEVEPAITELEKAKAIFTDNGEYDEESQFLLMNCFVAKNDFQKVLEYSREFLEKAEEDSQYISTARYYVPLALKNLGQMDEARTLYLEAIEELRNQSLNSPANLETYLLRALCHHDLDEYEKALNLVDYVIQMKPEFPEPRFQRIVILEAMGKKEEAQEEKKTVNAMLPPEARIQ